MPYILSAYLIQCVAMLGLFILSFNHHYFLSRTYLVAIVSISLLQFVTSHNLWRKDKHLELSRFAFILGSIWWVIACWTMTQQWVSQSSALMFFTSTLMLSCLLSKTLSEALIWPRLEKISFSGLMTIGFALYVDTLMPHSQTITWNYWLAVFAAWYWILYRHKIWRCDRTVNISPYWHIVTFWLLVTKAINAAFDFFSATSQPCALGLSAQPTCFFFGVSQETRLILMGLILVFGIVITGLLKKPTPRYIRYKQKND